jgi:CheY-like chemotaxis protein
LGSFEQEGKHTVDGSQERPTARGRILVVDDDAAVRTFLAEFFAQQNFDVRTAQNGGQALALLQVEAFEVIFVDFHMPGMTGLEVAAAVRRTHPHIPIALATGTANALDIDMVMRAGITRLFQKPFDLETLSSWIQSLSL